MGSNLHPDIRDPKRRYADQTGKGRLHRQHKDPVAKANWDKNAVELFGESPNLREK